MKNRPAPKAGVAPKAACGGPKPIAHKIGANRKVIVMLTIRGIPIGKLQKSELYPAIEQLAASWKRLENINLPEVDSATRKVFHACLWVMFLYFVILPLFTELAKRLIEPWKAAGIITALLASATIANLLLVAPLVRSIRELDRCLKHTNINGIATLPSTKLEAKMYLESRMVHMTKIVLFNEERDGRESKTAEEWRGYIKEFCAVLNEFRIDLGKHQPFYDRAAAELAGEATKRKNV